LVSRSHRKELHQEIAHRRMVELMVGRDLRQFFRRGHAA
jgi:hypothetical protein